MQFDIFIDISIAVVAALAQFITGYLGWQVTVEPLAPSDAKRKKIYMHVFWVSGLLGILAVTGGVFRAAKEQAGHDGQITSLNQTVTNQNVKVTELNAAIAQQNGYMSAIEETVGRPDIRGEPSYEVRVLEPGKKLVIDAVLYNSGILDALNLKFYYAVGVSDRSPEKGVDEGLVGQLTDAVKGPVESDQPSQIQEKGPSKTKYSVTLTSGFTLTKEQFTGVQSRTSTLYIALVFYYKSKLYYQSNSIGHYFTTLCSYGSGDFNTPLKCALTDADDFGQYVGRP